MQTRRHHLAPIPHLAVRGQQRRILSRMAADITQRREPPRRLAPRAAARVAAAGRAAAERRVVTRCLHCLMADESNDR